MKCLPKLLQSPLWLWSAALVGALVSQGVFAAPFVPDSDNQVLQNLPTRASDPVAKELANLRRSASQRSKDPSTQAALVQRYVDLANAEGDPRYIGYADAVVSAFSGLPNAELLTLKGVLRQYRHDFKGALQDFAHALAKDPAYAQAHAWRGAIYLVQADYSAARKECTALKQLGRGALHGACLGLAQSYSGDLSAGYRTLAEALAQTRSSDGRLWLLTRMGEVAAWQGQTSMARQHYQQALALGRDDIYLLAAWSDFLLDNGQAADVVKLLSTWESADSLLVRLAIAETLTGSPKAAAHVKMLADRFAAARARGDTTHLAEESRFELQVRKDAPTALRLAQENYAYQREPRDARVLLEAAVVARQAPAAQPVVDWLSASQFGDLRMKQLAKELK
ncbi:Tetratricopeptide repeat [Comamonadaceae bacterium]